MTYLSKRINKAFTLIELVIVIVIIGVLAGIAAFAYQNFANDARSTSTSALVTQFAKSYTGSRAAGQNDTQAFNGAVSDAGNGATITRITKPAVTRTNLIANPSFESGFTSGWASTNATLAPVTQAADLVNGRETRAARLTPTPTTSGSASAMNTGAMTNVNAGQQYTLSASLRRTSASARPWQLRIEFLNSSNAIIGAAATSSAINSGTNYTYATYSATAPAGTTQARAVILIPNAINTDLFFVDGIIFEQGAGGLYFDGGYKAEELVGGTTAWTGAANLTTSTWTSDKPYDVAQIRHHNNTWCYGLPIQDVWTSAAKEYTGSGNPPEGEYKKANCE